MAKADSVKIPIGVELKVKLVIGDGAIEGDLGTVTLEPGDTPDKVVAEFLFQIAEHVAQQTAMAKELIDLGLMTRVEVPADQVPDKTVVTGMTPDLLAMVLANAEDVNQAVTGGAWKPCEPVPYAEHGRGCMTPGAPGHELPVLTSYDCGGDGCACQPKVSE